MPYPQQRPEATYPPPQRHYPTPASKQGFFGGKQATGCIAAIMALIIFTMQMNWINIKLDIGSMSGSLTVDVVSQEHIQELMVASGIVDDFGDYPDLVDMINSLTNMINNEIREFTDTVNREIREFADRVMGFDPYLLISDSSHAISISDPPDIMGMINVFSDLILWEVTRVLGGVGELDQSISISDLPNLVEFTNLITNTIVREGVSWGMETEDVLRLDMEPFQTAEQIINILRIVFTVCALLMILFIYLLVAGAKPARLVGQITMIIVFLLSCGFGLAMFFGNRMVADALGSYIQISASWYVYLTAGLSFLGFVFICLHRSKNKYAR